MEEEYNIGQATDNDIVKAVSQVKTFLGKKKLRSVHKSSANVLAYFNEQILFMDQLVKHLSEHLNSKVN